jgi:hypothetical protein
MSLPSLRRAGAAFLLAAIALAAILTPGRVAHAGTVVYKNLVVHADGGFQPQTLPRHSYAPISFQGEVDIHNYRGGGRPPALVEAVIDFDRDGRLNVTGLPTCAPESINTLSDADARATCKGALVGEGEVDALIGAAAQPASAKLAIFNGPSQEGHPTAILHLAFSGAFSQNLALLAPIERRPGAFRYRVTIQVPPLAAGQLSLTRLAVDVGRRYTADGKRRSYVSARCSDHILRTHGIFTFAEGFFVNGSVEKYCAQR